MSCAVHTPSSIRWECESTDEENEFQHGSATLCTTCIECGKTIWVRIAFAAMQDEPEDYLPILGLPEDK